MSVFGCKITAFAKDGKYSLLGNLTTKQCSDSIKKTQKSYEIPINLFERCNFFVFIWIFSQKYVYLHRFT